MSDFTQKGSLMNSYNWGVSRCRAVAISLSAHACKIDPAATSNLLNTIGGAFKMLLGQADDNQAKPDTPQYT